MLLFQMKKLIFSLAGITEIYGTNEKGGADGTSLRPLPVSEEVQIKLR